MLKTYEITVKIFEITVKIFEICTIGCHVSTLVFALIGIFNAFVKPLTYHHFI